MNGLDLSNINIETLFTVFGFSLPVIRWLWNRWKDSSVKIDELQGKYEGVQSKYQDVYTKYTDNKAELDRVENNLKLEISSRQEFESKNEQLSDRLDKIIDRMVAIESDSKTQAAEINALTQKNMEQETHIETLTNAKVMLAAAVKTLEEANRKLQYTLEQRDKQLTIKDNVIEQKDTIIQDQDSEIGAHQLANSRIAQKLKAANAKNAELIEKITTLETKIETLTAKVETLTKRLDTQTLPKIDES